MSFHTLQTFTQISVSPYGWVTLLPPFFGQTFSPPHPRGGGDCLSCLSVSAPSWWPQPVDADSGLSALVITNGRARWVGHVTSRSTLSETYVHRTHPLGGAPESHSPSESDSGPYLIDSPPRAYKLTSL